MGPSPNELRIIPLFHGFSDDELTGLGRLFTPTPLPEGEHELFDVGEPALELYLLTNGDVTLFLDGEEFKLHPPALIGELGALTGLPRSTRALVSPGATVWSLPAKTIQAFFAANQELGVRFLANLLTVVADKVHRDQSRLGDMRQNLKRTQKELKRLRDLVLETPETPISAPVHDALDKLITHNRRVNYRVEPPKQLPAHLRLDFGTAPVADLSRTHVAVHDIRFGETPPSEGSWLSGVLHLAGSEIPISGRLTRVQGNRLTIELDLLIDEYAAALEGYLTRAQLLDVLV
ncbi:MAG TPA: cyclic nucleotide-binding domain-containing protein [Kofleriaceae bacterium]|nr:cyclic nucleotide-binding domain-containing protein [Kofleriaceae bacterium]